MLKTTARGLQLAVRVTPRASRAAIAGEENGRLKVRLNAPPVEGRANDELLKLLARALGLKKSQLRLAAGLKSRDKTVLLTGIGEDEAAALLGHPRRG